MMSTRNQPDSRPTEAEAELPYLFSVVPLIRDLPNVTKEQAETNAVSFLDHEGLENISIELALHILFIAVFHFTAKQKGRDEPLTGWVVGGHLPHLELNDSEIKTPIEALAIYALYERVWLDAKGVQQDDGRIPPYRLAPDWNLVSYATDLTRIRMGAMTSYIQWNILQANASHIRHEEIRERCIRRGFLQRESQDTTKSIQ
jgi:hypothetical protein